jgi:hypothetical protein
MVRKVLSIYLRTGHFSARFGIGRSPPGGIPSRVLACEHLAATQLPLLDLAIQVVGPSLQTSSVFLSSLG